MSYNYSVQVPTDVFRGLRAATVQSYTEANVKRGVQYEASAIFPDVASGGVIYTIFITGDDPIALKARHITYTGRGVKSDIFEGPTYSGGEGPIPYFNSNNMYQVPGSVEGYANPVVTDEGTQVFASGYSVGNQSNQGQGSTGIDLGGGENILKPNTTYLLKLESLDNSVQTIASFLYWYEGALDFPLKEGQY